MLLVRWKTPLAYVRTHINGKSMQNKKQTYLITIAVLEGRHYAWLNMDSAAIVKIGNQKKTTAVKKNSDCPFYNEVIF